MKIFGLMLILLFLTACSGERIEEIAFRETLEYKLIELCGENDKECITAVKSQTEECMKKSEWRKFYGNQDDVEETKRFVTRFYSCIVDPEGNPYFEPTL